MVALIFFYRAMAETSSDSSRQFLNETSHLTIDNFTGPAPPLTETSSPVDAKSCTGACGPFTEENLSTDTLPTIHAALKTERPWVESEFISHDQTTAETGNVLTKTDPANTSSDMCSLSMEKFEDAINENITDGDSRKWTCELRKFYVSRLPLRKSMQSVLIYYTLAIVVVGVVLNSLTFLILIKLRGYSCYYVYLSAIAIGDMSNLVLNFLVGVVRGLSPFVDSYFVRIPALCYSYSYAVEFGSLFPVWLVVVATGNTLLVVLFPLHAHKFANLTRTRQVLATTFICVAAWCMYKIPSGGLEVKSSFGYAVCRDVLYPTMVLISSLLMSIVPAGISFAMNILIVLKIRRSRQERKNMSLNDVITTRGSARRQTQMTRIVLLVSFAFIALVTPNRIIIAPAAFIEENRDAAFAEGDIKTYEYFAKFLIDNHFARQFGFMLYMLNFINNFFLYISFDKRFKQQFMKMFWCKIQFYMGSDVSSQPTASIKFTSTSEF